MDLVPALRACEHRLIVLDTVQYKFLITRVPEFGFYYLLDVTNDVSLKVPTTGPLELPANWPYRRALTSVLQSSFHEGV